jgi:hypothetical protein
MLFRSARTPVRIGANRVLQGATEFEQAGVVTSLQTSVKKCNRHHAPGAALLLEQIRMQDIIAWSGEWSGPDVKLRTD